MSDFLISICILYVGLFFVACIGGLLIFGVQKPFRNAKQALFLFKWFMIGKYHCDGLTTQQRVFFKLLHKLLWGGFIIGWALFLATIIEHLF